MIVTAAPTVKDQELMAFGMNESESVNSVGDFVSSDLNETQAHKGNEQNDFINIFICHLIFYSVFCISIVLYLLIDLGLGSFVKNKFIQVIQIAKSILVERNPAFA